MGLISLYQMGVLRHLPHPPVKGLDSDKVDGSPEAYRRLATPDAALGTASYAATLVLAAMGGKARARNHLWVPLALAAKVGFDVAQAVRMLVVQWTHFRSFCFWCLSLQAAPSPALLAWGERREQPLKH